MDSKTNGLTHDEIWDDSALVNSWNDALEEYKKYHSIQAAGSSQGAKPETHHDDDDNAVAAARDDSLPAADETGARAVPKQQQDTVPVDLDAGSVAAPAMQSTSGEAGVMAPPVALLGTVRDEALKKLLMSWYYAGYYTGLYEGQQQAQQPPAQ